MKSFNSSDPTHYAFNSLVTPELSGSGFWNTQSTSSYSPYMCLTRKLTEAAERLSCSNMCFNRNEGVPRVKTHESNQHQSLPTKLVTLIKVCFVLWPKWVLFTVLRHDNNHSKYLMILYLITGSLRKALSWFDSVYDPRDQIRYILQSH